jgi:hypothetical protein
MMDLPLELKQMILRELFEGSEITYDITISDDDQVVSYYFGFATATDHRNIHIVNKRCWNEGIGIYCKATALTIKGSLRDAGWLSRRLLSVLPSLCRMNMRTLRAVSSVAFDVASPLSQNPLREVLPALRNLQFRQPYKYHRRVGRYEKVQEYLFRRWNADIDDARSDDSLGIGCSREEAYANKTCVERYGGFRVTQDTTYVFEQKGSRYTGTIIEACIFSAQYLRAERC